MITKADLPAVFYKKSESVDKILDICELLSNVVGSTYGPNGKTVSFDSAGTVWPSYTKDGVTVASNFAVKDRFKQHIADTIIQAANRQLSKCGDGTTLTIILACWLIRRFLELSNKVNVTETINKERNRIILELREMSRPVDNDRIKDVINIAINNDKLLANVVSEAVEHAGDFGIILPRYSRSGSTYLSVDRGYQWRSGINMAHEFCMNIAGGVSCSNPHVLIINDVLIHEDDLSQAVKSIRNYHSEVKGILAKELKMKDLPSLIVIAQNFEHRAVQYAKSLKDQDKLHVVLVQPEGGYGSEDRAYHLNNIASFVGARICDGEANLSKRAVTVKDMGSCLMFHADTLGACFSGGNQTTIASRISNLTALKEQYRYNDPYSFKLVENSIARLNSLFATIHVGGGSESEIRERLDRVEDALKSVYSAKDGGFVPGGGLALYNADPDCKLCGNVAINKIFGNNYPNSKELLDQGIIDPTNNIVSALEHAVSVANCILDCEWFIIHE